MQKIIFVTDNYDYDYSFFTNELKQLSKLYDITVISLGKSDFINKIEGVDYHNYEISMSIIKKIILLLSYFFNAISYPEIIDVLKRKNRCLCLKQSIGYYYKSELFYHYLVSTLRNSIDEALLYSFWCNYYTLSFVNHFKGKNKIITRLHGYDLYHDRTEVGRFPFREVINHGVDKLIFIGDFPCQYYVSHYKNICPNKIAINRLGVNIDERLDRSVIRNAQIKEYPQNDKFIIVSCSSLIPLKRIDLLIEALSLIKDISIQWVHFGDGMLKNELLKYCAEILPDNIDYDFRGYVTNSAIWEFYINNYIDVFINVSETEGAPVSIMEAMAAGIPIVAPVVGDIPQMIINNGILLSKNPNGLEIANSIKYLRQMSKEDVLNVRKSSYLLWEEKYNSNKNVKEFVGILATLV